MALRGMDGSASFAWESGDESPQSKGDPQGQERPRYCRPTPLPTLMTETSATIPIGPGKMFFRLRY
jgi:hypothetical protein